MKRKISALLAGIILAIALAAGADAAVKDNEGNTAQDYLK